MNDGIKAENHYMVIDLYLRVTVYDHCFAVADKTAQRDVTG